MGRRGPKPEDAGAKELKGNPGRRAVKATAAAATRPGAPKMPPGLSDEEKREWKRVVPPLVELGIITPMDQRALRDYVRCSVRLEEAERDVGERGILIQGERGMVKNPALQVAREYRSALVKWCQLFGMTPDARGRMTLPEPDAEDPFEEFLGRR